MNSPIFFVIIAFSFCLVRWVFIASGVDMGWDFETGYRVARGEVYGRDYYTLVGPVAYSLVGAVLRQLGTYLIFLNGLYAVFWAASVGGIYVLLRSLSERKESVAFALLAVLPFSEPHLLPLHLYNYLSVALAVWTLVLCYRFIELGKWPYPALAGALAAIALFTKQNVGMGTVLVGAVVLGLVPRLGPKRTTKASWVGLAAFLGSFSFLAAGLFFTFSHPVGTAEFLRLMFADAAAAKGDLATMVGRSLPLFHLGTPELGTGGWFLQLAVELTACALILGLNFAVFRTRSSERGVSHRELKVLLAVSIGILFCLVPLAVLWPATEIHFGGIFGINLQYNLTVFLVWLVVVSFAFYLVALRRDGLVFSEPYYRGLTLFLLSLVLCAVSCFSNLGYVFLFLPLLLGTLLVGLVERGHLTGARRAIVFIGINLCVFIFYPRGALGPLRTVDDSQARGLLFSKIDARNVETYVKRIRPYVEGKRTLWLKHGGPHSLTGALPVKNVSNLYADQYPARLEPLLFADWKENPPERIVRSWVVPSGEVFKGEAFTGWLNKNYVLMATLSGNEIWKRRE